MLPEGRLVIGPLGMAPTGIKGASPLELMVPGNGMAFPMTAPLITGFLQIEQYIDLGVQVLEVVPLIGACPDPRQMGSGWVPWIDHPNVGLLHLGMVHKISAHQAAVPRPVKLRVGGR